MNSVIFGSVWLWLRADSALLPYIERASAQDWLREERKKVARFLLDAKPGQAYLSPMTLALTILLALSLPLALWLLGWLITKTNGNMGY